MSSRQISSGNPSSNSNHSGAVHHFDQQEPLNKNYGQQNLVSVLNDPTAQRSHSDYIFLKDWGSSFVEQPTICSNVNLDEQRMKELKRCAQQRTKILKRFDEQIRLKAKMRDTSTLNENLEKIPGPFLESDFHVEKQETLLFILGQKRSGDRKKASDVSPLSVRESQHVLSDLLDVVEDHLSNQISARFRDFFQIMSAMDLVMDQVSKTIREVTSVRRKCNRLKQSLIKPCVQTILLTKKRCNAANLIGKLSLMKVVHQSSYKVNILLSSKDYVRALDLVRNSRKIVKEQLYNIKCCQYLDSELQEREKLIDEIMQEDLEKLLTTEWHQPLSHSTEEEYSCSNEELLVSITIGLLRTHKSERIIDVFKEEACAAVITVIKQTLIEALAAEDMDISNRLENHLFDQVKLIDSSRWLQTLDKIFRKLSILMKRVKAVHLIILRTIYQVHGKVLIGQSSACTSDVDVLIQSDEMFEECKNLAESSFTLICDFAQRRTSEFIERRLTVSPDRFSHSDFKLFSMSVGNFSSECDILSGKKNNYLKSVLKTQANKFASRYHDERRKKLNSLLDIEQWKSMTSIPEELPSLILRLSAGQVSSQNGFPTEKNKSGPSVSIGDEHFILVNSVVLLVNLIDEYCNTAHELQVLAADLLTRLFDLLNLFNQRTFELIYDGKAKQVAGLNVITSRILANSWRALELVIKLIPSIKGIFSSLIPSKSHPMIDQFDDIVKKYNENVSKLQEKVVNASLDVISSNLNKWEARPPVPSSHFMAITQHLTVLDANLEESIPPEQLVHLFKRIDMNFKEILKEHLKRLKVVNDGGPQYG